MRLGFSSVENVNDCDAVRLEIIGNQRPMTTPPNSFRAHDGGRPGNVGKIEKPGDPVTKFVRLYVIGVAAEGCVTPRGVA